MLQVARRGDQACDFLAAKHHRQGARHATGCILAISSPRPSVTSKKNFRPVIVALSVIGEVPCVDQVQLEAPQVLDRGGVGRAA